MNIWISGPTGAGKTSLTGIAKKCGFGVVNEQLPRAKFEAFVIDPTRYCSELQREIMHSRFNAWQALPDRSKVVFDRSIDEDINVFCRMHYESGFLSEKQFQV